MAKRLTRFVVESLGLAIGQVTALRELTSLPGVVAPDWTKSIDITNEWNTSVSQSKVTLAEERRGYRSRPLRSMKVYFNELSQERYHELQMWRMRLSQHRNSVPVFTDITTLDFSIGAGTVVLNCDTSDRRFYPGARIGITHPEFADTPIGSSSVRRIQTAVVSSVADEALVLETGGVDFAAPIGSFVFPMMDCFPVLGSTGDTHTTHYGSANITFSEIPGPSALPAAWVGPFDSEFTFYDTPDHPATRAPIVNLRSDWSRKTKVDIVRAGKTDVRGYSPGVSVDGPRPQFRFVQSPTALSRKEAFDHLRLFDSLKGRQESCYFVNPQDMFESVVAFSDYVDVRPFGYFRDLVEFLTHVAIVTDDGEVFVRKIISAAQQTPTTYRITVDEGWPVGVGNIARCTSAHLVRNEKDNLKQTWVTDSGVALCDFSFIEVLNERIS